MSIRVDDVKIWVQCKKQINSSSTKSDVRANVRNNEKTGSRMCWLGSNFLKSTRKQYTLDNMLKIIPENPLVEKVNTVLVYKQQKLQHFSKRVFLSNYWLLLEMSLNKLFPNQVMTHIFTFAYY